ncbi:DUF5590 domain-containing protein [Planococcus sp. ISL-109]|uniref:cell wall elongation regulator TseB-like domain-containing protein n=1 Tax=Planococcus sp. ISL-109 TaxID=2819166 RepID=UPI001BE84187|nr:DUF5590 domain-containing protein [Planococcus sp. ISL-109]MBT2582069.1 DUF5590 domain-containing protein [Planococcus sp. ISL-109]
MKEWMKFIVGFLALLAVVIVLIILFLGNKPFSETEQAAIEQVEADGVLSEVDRAYVYTSAVQSVTVLGTDEEGRLKAVFVSEDGEMETLMLEDQVTAQQAREIVQADMEVKKILHTKLGMESAGAVWEIAFLNESDRLNYVYLLAEDGTWWKRILNL